jgi:hypothetical protein
LRRVPMPEAWKRDPALAKVYNDAVGAMSEGIRSSRAKPAMMKCVDLSVKYQFFDARSRACDQWLAKSYKVEHHAVEELIPGFVSGPGPTDMPPLGYEGQVLRGR